MEETEKMKAEHDKEIKRNTFNEETGMHDKEKDEKLFEENKNFEKVCLNVHPKDIEL